MSHVHVIGAGLAGLSAAVALRGGGIDVTVWEAAAQAGGRCRSYHDPQLDMMIDNGNHLVLSGNEAVAAYLARIGASDRLAGPDSPRFAFVDLEENARWVLRPNDGPIPWWVMSSDRRVPGTSAGDYLALKDLVGADADSSVGQTIPTQGALWRRLLDPFLLAALNVPAATGSARLAGEVVRQSLMRGGRAYRPRVADPSLAATFVDPAIAYIGDVRLGRRLRSLDLSDDRARALTFSDGPVDLGGDDVLILAVPPWVAAELIPDLRVPTEHQAIANGHFKISVPQRSDPIVGVVGGFVEWIFVFPDRVSVTISGANRLEKMEREELARRMWADVSRVLDLPIDLPPWQVVRERRATFAATPDQDALRPSTETRWSNILLAGDWTQTDLPGTIEGAIRSGNTAAKLAKQRLSR